MLAASFLKFTLKYMYIHKKVKLLIKNNNEPGMNTETKKKH